MRSNKFKITVTFLLNLTLILALFSNAFAWYGPYYHPNGDSGDIHKADTKNWALEAGMSKVWAVQAAESDAMVDVYYKMNLQWHLDRSKFSSTSEDTRVKISREQFTLAKRELDSAADYKVMLGSAKSIWDRSKYNLKLLKSKEDAIVYLGRALHPIQDLYSNMDAGVNKNNSEIGLSHGTLDSPPVDVTIINKDGTSFIRKMKLEEKGSNGLLYSLYDDAYYDYDGGWIFRVDGKKEDNKRWRDTKNASVAIINDFMAYAASKGIDYKN